MITPKLLSQAEVKARLEAKGFREVGHISVSGGDYSVWVTDWGEPLMVPEDGPDKVCAEIFLYERMDKVLATKPKGKK